MLENTLLCLSRSLGRRWKEGTLQDPFTLIHFYKYLGEQYKGIRRQQDHTKTI